MQKWKCWKNLSDENCCAETDYGTGVTECFHETNGKRDCGLLGYLSKSGKIYNDFNAAIKDISDGT